MLILKQLVILSLYLLLQLLFFRQSDLFIKLFGMIILLNLTLFKSRKVPIFFIQVWILGSDHGFYFTVIEHLAVVLGKCMVLHVYSVFDGWFDFSHFIFFHFGGLVMSSLGHDSPVVGLEMIDFFTVSVDVWEVYLTL